MQTPTAWLVVLCTTTACVQEVHRGGRADDAGGDAGASDGDRIPDCDAPQMFFADRDGDGHGDATMPISACAQPADTVTNSDDCDDASADRHPGATEICDALDNDCSAATVEACPTGCQAMRRPPPDADDRAYLFCSQIVNWPTAQATCANAGFHLVEIDSAEENVFVRTTATTLLGGNPVHTGGNDIVALGQFLWDGGELFWVGGSNGQPQNGHFATWGPGEPNGSGLCVELRTDNLWYDNNCGDGQRFVCRR
jgi:hypothetical protein